MKSRQLFGYRHNRLVLFTRSGQRFLRRLQVAWILFLVAACGLALTLVALVVAPGALASTAFLVAILSLVIAAVAIWFLYNWRPEPLDAVAEDLW
jgi:hypothetical protein